MKRLASIILLSVAYLQGIFAQTDEVVITWPMVVAEAKKTDETIINPKKSANSRTWTERGRKYMEVFAFDLKSAYPGMKQTDVMLYMKGKEKSSKNQDGFDILSFDRIDLYFKDGILKKYTRTGDALQMFPEHTTPLDIAAESYIKAKEYDLDGKRSILIAEQLQKIIEYYTNEGYYFYMLEDYKQASVYFSKMGDILVLGIDNNSDSSRYKLLGDCGTMAKVAKNYDNAIKYYESSLKFTKIPTIETYGNIMYCQKMKGDTASAIQTLTLVIEKFPNDENIVAYTTELINLYIAKNQYDQALTYLNKAIEKDPNNSNFLFNIGYLYEASGETDKAIASYEKALVLNPKDEGSNLNLGLIYVKEAKKVLEEAEQAWGTKNYKPLNDKGKALLAKAYPYIEVYASVVEDISLKKNAYKDLSSIYGQLNMTADYNRITKLRAELDKQ